MLAIWSAGRVQVFKLAALIPLITAVPNGGGSSTARVRWRLTFPRPMTSLFPQSVNAKHATIN